jgi:hypothetical protein
MRTDTERMLRLLDKARRAIDESKEESRKPPERAQMCEDPRDDALEALDEMETLLREVHFAPVYAGAAAGKQP